MTDSPTETKDAGRSSAASSSGVLISVIVPAFNEEKLLARNLQRIRHALVENLNGESAFEIVVCDNNSTDETSAIAEAAGANLVFEPDRQISKARNRGASVARGEWFLFIDADSYPSVALVADVLQCIDSAMVIGGGSTLQFDGPRWFRWAVEGKVNLSARLFKLVGGAFLLCHANAFRAIGGFSEELYAMEELDFVRRLRRHARARGKRFVVLHRNPYTTSGRKGELYSPWELFRFVVAAALSPSRICRSRERLGIWYDGRR